MTRRYNSLADFLIATPLTIDVSLDDGWGEGLSVKGREVDAAVLSADITGFSRQTADFNPAETLIFVNNFLAWITAEGLTKHGGLIDKYVGDEVIVVFAREFGSKDPVADAFKTATAMADFDVLSFCPHFGIAAGRVMIGFTGSRLAFHPSVFGRPVTLAARCAAFEGKEPDASYAITFPAELWSNLSVQDVAPGSRYKGPEGREIEQPATWQVGPPREYKPKNIAPMFVRQLFKTGLWLPQQCADERALAIYKDLWNQGKIREGASPPCAVPAHAGWVKPSGGSSEATTPN